MRENGLGTKILMLVLTLGVVAYFGLQSARYFTDPLATVVAYTYQVEEGETLTGYVVRKERVLEDDTNGLLQLKRAEGERVSAGGTVAAVYPDRASMDRQDEIEKLELRVDQLRFAQEAALGAEASLKLDSQILRSIRTLKTDLAGDRLDRAENSGAELRALVLKRDYTAEDAENLTAELQELQDQLKTLKGQAAQSTRRVKAPVSGLYSAVVDGFEAVLTPETVVDLGPSQLTGLRPDSSVHSDVGKLILGDEWRYAAVMKTETARELKDLQDGGKQLTLRFAKNVEQVLPVRLESIGLEESGRSVAVFRGRTHLSQLTLLRQQSAQVISSVLEGIRVPKEALHATETRLDRETGEEIREEQTGVYCLVGKEAWFKPVEVLYNGDGFLLVKPTAEKEENILRPGDQVIAAARGLYDGKVVG